MLTDIDKAIKEQLALGNEPDPSVIASRLLQHGSVDISDEFIEWALGERVKLYQRTARNLPEAVEDDGAPSTQGRSRWSQVREVAPFVNKFVDELTEADIIEIINSYNAKANSYIAKANEYRQMLDDLRASGCSTVGEMQSSVVGASQE
jgi:hypothetical protein